MVVLVRGYGNHSNRLLQNIHFEAFCLEHGLSYANPSFAAMHRYYVAPVRVTMRYAARVVKDRYVRRLARLGICPRIQAFDREDPQCADRLLAQVRAGRNCYVEGWWFRVPGLTKKHQDALVPRYTLKKEYYIDNPMYIELCGNNRVDTALVGIHIRRGDYRTWQNGLYCYDDAVYIKCMAAMKSQVLQQTGRQCRFLVFSNEPVTLPPAPDVWVSQNQWYIDHLLMSRCDYLLGPPSSFTLWASYVGKTKFAHIRPGAQGIDLREFACYLG